MMMQKNSAKCNVCVVRMKHSLLLLLFLAILAYGLFQAITQYETHDAGRLKNDTERARARLESLWGGSGAKRIEKAREALLALVGSAGRWGVLSTANVSSAVKPATARVKRLVRCSAYCTFRPLHE